MKAANTHSQENMEKKTGYFHCIFQAEKIKPRFKWWHPCKWRGWSQANHSALGHDDMKRRRVCSGWANCLLQFRLPTGNFFMMFTRCFIAHAWSLVKLFCSEKFQSRFWIPAAPGCLFWTAEDDKKTYVENILTLKARQRLAVQHWKNKRANVHQNLAAQATTQETFGMANQNW